MEKSKKPLSKRFKIVAFSIIAVCLLIFVGIMALPDPEPETTTAAPAAETTQQTAAPSEEEFLKKLTKKLDGAIGEKEKITDVTLKNKTLTVYVDLSATNPAPLTAEDLALSRAGSITDDVLDYSECLSLWETVTVDFGEIGKVTAKQSAAKENEYGMLCFPAEELTLSPAD